MRNWIASLLMVFVMGCAAVKQEVLRVAGNDLQRTSDIAARYGKPEVKQCADFLVQRIGELNAADATLEQLLAEETEGVFSAALKAVLVKEHLASLNDPARVESFRKEFDVACKAVAGAIVLNVARDAAKVTRRGN